MSLTETTYAHTPTMRSILTHLFDTETFSSNSPFKKQWIPSVNVKDAEKRYEIDLAAPGLKKEDFKIEIQNNILTISAESVLEKEEKDKKYTRKEFNYHSFSRSFALPVNVEEDSIEAKYEEGILKLTLNKTKTETYTKKVINLQ